MPESFFVITLGDIIGLSMFGLCVVSAAVWVLYKAITEWWRERKCDHDFEAVQLRLNGNRHWTTSGYRCRKCKQERTKL